MYVQGGWWQLIGRNGGGDWRDDDDLRSIYCYTLLFKHVHFSPTQPLNKHAYLRIIFFFFIIRKQ